jgi:archaeal type IV pilus assembly protein PilA
MTHRCKKLMNKSDCGVSPVVGILLMLIVTIILAAVISAYTGQLAKPQDKAPQIIIEASLTNLTDDNNNESLDMRVISIDGSVNSKDLMLKTEWKNSSGVYSKTVKPGENNYPKGYAPGSSLESNFGNYTLVAGSRMNVNSSRSNPENLNSVIASWTSISDGTPVRIQFVHIPSGAVIVDKEVIADV